MRTRETLINESLIPYEELEESTIQLDNCSGDYERVLDFFQLNTNKPEDRSVVPMEITIEMRDGYKHRFYPTQISSNNPREGVFTNTFFIYNRGVVMINENSDPIIAIQLKDIKSITTKY